MSAPNNSQYDWFDLPMEVEDDWFDIPCYIDVKNRHLINIAKPISASPILSHGPRTTPPCPKTIISPWLPSNIEPDYDIKPFF